MKMTISIAQMAVARSGPEENLRKADRFAAEAKRRGSDLICFPEMWTTGFNWADNERLLAKQQSTVERVAEMARRHSIWINGSMLAPDEKLKAANTSILFDSGGKKAGIYRKTHLFTLLREDEHMAPGDSLCVVDTPWGLTGLTICYDIRFPELFRTYALKGVKIVLSPMAFPVSRIEHWKILVRARAIEDQLFMIGANQVGEGDFGEDGMVPYAGSSAIIDPWGDTIIEGSQTKEELLTATIDTDKSDEVRSKMRVLKDRRPDLYELG